jgi:hypothetical protein
MLRGWPWRAALTLVAAILSLHPLTDVDSFWHLTLGRAVVAAHARTVVEPVAMAPFTDRCVAAEWLWEAWTWLCYRAGGYALLSWLVAACAAACAWTTSGLACAARTVEAERRFGAPLVVTTLTLMALLSRMVLRPQAAYLVLLPWFVTLSLALAAAPEPHRRWRLGASLVAIELVWAQLHGSFILGPLVFAAVALGEGTIRDRSTRPVALGVLLGLGVASLTSAHGPAILIYVLEHSGGDAVRHIGDMMAPNWGTLNPISPYALGWWGLVLLAITGTAAARHIWWTGWALAALGAALFATATRFFDAAAILTVPLAVRGLDALGVVVTWRRAGPALATATSLALFAWFAPLVQTWYGPTGRTGVDEARLPLVAAAYLLTAPPGNVLSTYEPGGPLGFFLYGRDRTFVDGRTPLYFDDSDYAVARELWYDEGALQRGLVRYQIRYAVAPRESALCMNLKSRWDIATVEGDFTTFVPRGTTTAPLTHLLPCGQELLPPNACADYDATVAELERLSSLRPSPLWSIVRSDLGARCDRPAPLPARADAWAYDARWRRAAARVAVHDGRAAAAAALVRPLVADGDVGALAILRPRFADLVPDELRALMESAARSLDALTPPPLRADLARLCMATGDAECVRFHGLRAAARGVPSARAPLSWLAEHHPSARVRADARAWLALLPATEPAGDPPGTSVSP